jgi:hypothetical protein
MRRQLIIVTGLLVLIFGAFVFLLLAVIFTPKAPAGWGQIHVGMTRSQVITLIGAPQQSGWPENITEMWERRGLISRRRLFILYDGEHYGERVQHLSDGTWVPGFGWSHRRE